MKKLFVGLLALIGLFVFNGIALAGGNIPQPKVYKKVVKKKIIKKKIVEKNYHNSFHSYINGEDNWDVIVELDAPKIIRFGSSDWYVGGSIAKKVNGTDAKSGWEGRSKVLYDGTILNPGGK